MGFSATPRGCSVGFFIVTRLRGVACVSASCQEAQHSTGRLATMEATRMLRCPFKFGPFEGVACVRFQAAYVCYGGGMGAHSHVRILTASCVYLQHRETLVSPHGHARAVGNTEQCGRSRGHEGGGVSVARREGRSLSVLPSMRGARDHTGPLGDHLAHVLRAVVAAFGSRKRLWATHGRPAGKLRILQMSVYPCLAWAGGARHWTHWELMQLHIAQIRMMRREARRYPRVDEEFPAHARRNAALARYLWAHMGMPHWSKAVVASCLRWASHAVRIVVREPQGWISHILTWQGMVDEDRPQCDSPWRRGTNAA